MYYTRRLPRWIDYVILLLSGLGVFGLAQQPREMLIQREYYASEKIAERCKRDVISDFNFLSEQVFAEHLHSIIAKDSSYVYECLYSLQKIDTSRVVLLSIQDDIYVNLLRTRVVVYNGEIEQLDRWREKKNNLQSFGLFFSFFCPFFFMLSICLSLMKLCLSDLSDKRCKSRQ